MPENKKPPRPGKLTKLQAAEIRRNIKKDKSPAADAIRSFFGVEGKKKMRPGVGKPERRGK